MVSFIILNYNSSLLVKKCIASIETYMPANHYEVVVVDNGSRPEEYALLDELASGKDQEAMRLHIVRKEVNTGFGTGNMIGASVAQGTFLHVHDASTSSMRRQALRENYVSRIYTYRKYHGMLTSLIYQLILTLQQVFKPRKWYILPTVVSRHVLSHSMRHQADGHRG